MPDIEVKRYNYKTNMTEDVCTVGVNELASSMDPTDFRNLLSDYMNMGGKQYREGLEIGELLRTDHRTLQRGVIAFALGLIIGLSHQEHWDDRNATAIATAKKLEQMARDGQLPLGPYL